VQGAMESAHRGRRYLGKRRRIEGRVSKFLFLIRPNLKDEIHFKGGRFVAPWFSQENKTLENCLFK
jgi:hypothetical protein